MNNLTKLKLMYIIFNIDVGLHLPSIKHVGLYDTMYQRCSSLPYLYLKISDNLILKINMNKYTLDRIHIDFDKFKYITLTFNYRNLYDEISP